jgi:hypothetical protein
MHSRAMEIRLIDLLAAIGGAALAASLLAIITHDTLGLPRTEIREVSLIAAFLLVVACILGTAFRRES